MLSGTLDETVQGSASGLGETQEYCPAAIVTQQLQ